MIAFGALETIKNIFQTLLRKRIFVETYMVSFDSLVLILLLAAHI